jgi:hypothetical protein
MEGMLISNLQDKNRRGDLFKVSPLIKKIQPSLLIHSRVAYDKLPVLQGWKTCVGSPGGERRNLLFCLQFSSKLVFGFGFKAWTRSHPISDEKHRLYVVTHKIKVTLKKA